MKSAASPAFLRLIKMNGWFPKINSIDQIASGSSGIWLTIDGKSIPVDSIGTSPVWCGQILIYNHNDGTSRIGGQTIPKAYNKYQGSDDTKWAGFTVNPVSIDVYDRERLVASILNATNPRFGLNQFGYLTPYQASQRSLIINGAVFASGIITDFQLGNSLEQCVWKVPGGLLTSAGSIQIGIDEVPLRVFTYKNQPWLMSGTSLVGGISFIRPFNSYLGYVIKGDLYYPDCRIISGSKLRVVGSTGKGELLDYIIDLESQRVDLRLYGEEIGPRSASRTDNGHSYDTLDYILCEQDLQPRSGPTHPQNQIQIDNIIHWVKFGNPQAYESRGYDDNWVTFIGDLSGNPPNYFSDGRWHPRKMRIGEANAFITGPHELIKLDRGTCKELGRDPINRKAWVLYLYDDFYWGPDLKHLPTIAIVYDNTAGWVSKKFYGKDRIIEVNYFAYKAGWCRWEAHRSDLVYKNSTPVFDDTTRVGRSDFYLLHGPKVGVQLTNCVKQEVIHYPSLSPIDPIKPIPRLQIMDPEIVSLVFNDYYGRFDGNKIVFDQSSEGPSTDWVISKPDDRFTIQPKDHSDLYLGSDATSFSTDIAHEFYIGKSHGNYESWFIGVRPSGLIEAVIEYIDQGVNRTVPFCSAALTIKRHK